MARLATRFSLVLLTAALLSVSGTTAVAQTAPAPATGVAGVYSCEGANPDGSRYQGLVEIAAIDNTYLVRWVLQNELEIWGVGILNDGLLSVSYFGGTPAVVVYRVDGERLVGEWTMGGTEGKVYAETLTRMKEGEAPPIELPRPEPKPRAPKPIRGVHQI